MKCAATAPQVEKRQSDARRICPLSFLRLEPRQLIACDSLDGQRAQPGPQGGAAPPGPPPAQPRQVAAGLAVRAGRARLGAAFQGPSVARLLLRNAIANRKCFRSAGRRTEASWEGHEERGSTSVEETLCFTDFSRQRALARTHMNAGGKACTHTHTRAHTRARSSTHAHVRTL